MANIKYIPDGMEVYYNDVLGKESLRLKQGFSLEYLQRNAFIPFHDVVVKSNSTNKNSNLHSAKKEKNDEFYTNIDDINNELKHYKTFFRDKIVYLPCDKVFNIGRSEFVNYFIYHFKELGLKQLICTQYTPNGNGLKKELNWEGGMRFDYNGEYGDITTADETMFNVTPLKGDGSFDSEECKEIMKNCDIVVTNPPFSLFRDFIKQIMDFNKKFLIISNENAITYKEVFPYIKNNQMWMGYTKPKEFATQLQYVEDDKKQYIQDGVVYQKFGNICWFTNLEHNKRKELLYINQKYSENKYPKYDNYNAIEVGKVKDIPIDYNGVMGVPISFLDKYCPTQFQIVGITENADYLKELYIDGNEKYDRPYLNSKRMYSRLLIRKFV